MSIKEISNFIFFHFDRLKIIPFIVTFIPTHMRSIITTRYFNQIYRFGNITIVAYEEPFFVDKEGIQADYKDVIYIVIAVLIVLLLGYVVIRSLKTDKVKEEEPEELSVEGLLQFMPSRPLEDISLDDKSDVRKLIEKFVDENPEAVANLLRNWLNEDWG